MKLGTSIPQEWLKSVLISDVTAKLKNNFYIGMWNWTREDLLVTLNGLKSQTKKKKLLSAFLLYCDMLPVQCITLEMSLVKFQGFFHNETVLTLIFNKLFKNYHFCRKKWVLHNFTRKLIWFWYFSFSETQIRTVLIKIFQCVSALEKWHSDIFKILRRFGADNITTETECPGPPTVRESF